MRTQIDYLITMSRLPNIQLQVLPFKTNTYHGALVSYRFMILRIPSPGVSGPLKVVWTTSRQRPRSDVQICVPLTSMAVIVGLL